MTLREKLNLDYEGLIANGPITIVAFGDSVTHGAVGAGEMDYETVYHHRLAKMITDKWDYVPINVINAGIGGITAKDSLDRMEKQVFAHNPELVIVAFGLNDVNGELDEYLNALRTIFSRCQERGIETVFMMPNMLNTRVVEGTEERFVGYAHVTAEMQNGGRMDKYMYSAKELALEMGVKVADCYSKWKELSKTQDTTLLLANYINHPIREMHQLFAQTLFDTIFAEGEIEAKEKESTMYRK
ncbi:MAG: GDSL family lipase [Clostridiales bacterium]|nr:GDSL family lipase [Clostridiales bacterium]